MQTKTFVYNDGYRTNIIKGSPIFSLSHGILLGEEIVNAATGETQFFISPHLHLEDYYYRKINPIKNPLGKYMRERSRHRQYI